MATIYGNTTNHWRCYINTWSSEDAVSVSAGLTVGIQDCGWGFQIWSGIVGHASANGSKSVVNTGFNTPTGSWNTKDITSASNRFVKGHNAYDIWLSGTVTNNSGYMNGSSSATQYLTIPALAHHYVTFDANGGTGAPGRVDKWYGEALTIPSQKPTRTNYEFLGWSKTSNGTAEYQSGKTYNGTPDSDYTLYAVWKLLYVPPKFTDGLAIRTSSITSTTSDYSGGYCYASFSYKVDTTVYSDNVAKSIVCRYYQNGSTTGVVVTPTGDLNKASGTINVHFAASINSVYYIECTLTDNKDGTATIARSITTGVLPMEVANQGKSVGILSAAPSSAGLNLGGSGNPDFLISADTTNNQLESMAQIHGSTSSDGQGELTLSTQGLNSSGMVDSGSISMIAKNISFNNTDFSTIVQAPAGTPTNPNLITLNWGVFRLPGGLCILTSLGLTNWMWTPNDPDHRSRTVFSLPIQLANTNYNVVYGVSKTSTLNYDNQISITTESKTVSNFLATSWLTPSVVVQYDIKPIVIGQYE